MLAMYEALSRICEEYYQQLLPDSMYRQFGKRDTRGMPYWTEEGRNEMGFMEIHLEDLEMLAYGTETIFRAEMKVLDQAKELIQKQRADHDCRKASSMVG